MAFPYPARAVRIEAEGYFPAESEPFPLDNQVKNLEFRLKKGEGPRGMVLDSNGVPVSDAVVVMAVAGQAIQFSLDRFDGFSNSGPTTRSKANGEFSLPPQTEEFAILAVHDSGYCIVTLEELAKSEGKIVLESWAKVNGIAMVNGQPAAGERVMGSYSYPNQRGARGRGGPQGPRILFSFSAVTDRQGRFHLSRVPAEQISISRLVPMQIGGQRAGMTSSASTTVSPKPGETVKVTLGENPAP